MSHDRYRLLAELVNAAASLQTASIVAIDLGDTALAAEIKRQAIHLNAAIAQAGGSPTITEHS